MKVISESEVTQSCPTLSDLMDCSLPGSSVHGIFQARVVEWGAIAFSLVLLSSSQTLSSRRTALQRGFSSSGLLAFWARSLLCCLVFSLSCDPMDCSPPGSSVPGLSQARILKWVAISLFRGIFPTSNRTRISCTAGKFFTAEPPGNPADLCTSWLRASVASTPKMPVVLSPPPAVTTKHVSRYCHMYPRGAKSPLVENHCYMGLNIH